jgi:hypothetical protein
MAKPIKTLFKDATEKSIGKETSDLAGSLTLPSDCSIPLVCKANIEGAPDDVGSNYETLLRG